MQAARAARNSQIVALRGRRSNIQRVIKYHPLLVVTHWLLAVLFTIEGLRQHLAGGTLLVVLMLLRLVVRVRTARPARASTGSPALDRLAWLSHRMLYVLVFCQAASGLTLAVQAGLPDVLFGGHGALPADFRVFPMRPVHYAISRLLMALIALHVLAALYHTFILRDGLLRRMWFGRRKIEVDRRRPDRV
jgi:cytochrome b561